MSQPLRHLFRDNPMNLETTRIARRFLRTSGETSNKVNRAIGGILIALYLWVLFAILYYREDMSQMVLWLEFVLLTLAVPGSMYAAISGERERLTWDSLIMTRLSPARILIGKLLWRLGMVAVILALFTVPLVLTHVAAKQTQADYTLGALGQAQAIAGTWSVFLAAFSLLISARTKRSVTTLSILTAFLFAFLLLVPVLVSVLTVPPQNSYLYEWHAPTVLQSLGSFLTHANPFVALMDLTANQSRYGNGSHDFWRDDIHLMDGLAYLYLGLTALSMAGTLKALRRLGLPIRGGVG